jgi:hypothetical protein
LTGSARAPLTNRLLARLVNRGDRRFEHNDPTTLHEDQRIRRTKIDRQLQTPT